MIPPSYVRIRSPSGLSILCAAERNRWMPISSSPLSGKKQKQDSTVFSQKTGNQQKWWLKTDVIKTILGAREGL